MTNDKPSGGPHEGEGANNSSNGLDLVVHTCKNPDLGQYELTVTEDSLMRLHGLSLTLPIPCDLCPPGTVFDDLDEFDAHMVDHPEAKMFSCQLCCNTYKTWSNLIAHRKMFHMGEVLSCEDCGKRRSYARLEGAVDYPVGGKPHGCEECEIGLNSLTEVYRHYTWHMAPPGPPKGTRDTALKSMEKNAKGISGTPIPVPASSAQENLQSPVCSADAGDPGDNSTTNLACDEANNQEINVPVNEESVAEPDESKRGHKHFCPHCEFSCITLERYRIHMSRFFKAHMCTVCTKTQFKNLTNLDHEYCQSKPLQFSCIVCMLAWDSEEAFASHLKEFHADDGPVLPCCMCGCKYDWSKFVEHVKVCQRKHNEWEARRNIERKTCQLCGKCFQRPGALRRHMKLHETSRIGSHDCATCHRSFRHGGAYAKHLSANPTHGPAEMQAKPSSFYANFVCEYCGRTFSKREGLRVHLLRHSGVKPFPCPNCPKAFFSRTSMVIHMRQHTGERPYMCEFCGKKFTGPTSLYVHQRSHRLCSGTEEAKRSQVRQKHVCPVCGKVLSSKLVYEGHIRKHTGERPFTCHVCSKGFTSKKILKTHIKRHEIKGNNMASQNLVAKKGWVEEQFGLKDGGKNEVFAVCDSENPACIFLCPKCGVGMLTPEELEVHMARGDCPGGGSEMFVLPMNNGVECMDTGSVVELLANAATMEVANT